VRKSDGGSSGLVVVFKKSEKQPKLTPEQLKMLSPSYY